MRHGQLFVRWSRLCRRKSGRAVTRILSLIHRLANQRHERGLVRTIALVADKDGIIDREKQSFP